jgi:hypothetical protein
MQVILAKILICVGVVFVIIWFIRWVIQLPVEPDPWEGEVDKKDLEGDAKALCLNCSRPVDNPSQHYCPNCGNITGEYTRYIPFVNIRYNYSIFGKIWFTLKNPDAAMSKRILCFLLILICPPLMLFYVLALPIILCGALKRRFTNDTERLASFNYKHPDQED